MENNHVKRLTEGSPLRLLTAFIVPLLFGLLFQQFYSMIDTIVVGKFLGVQALAGVGSTGAVNFLILGFCTGICSGFSIPVAQKFGQRDMQGLRRIVGNMVWCGGIIAAVMTTAVTLLCSNILHWMHTPDETFVYAHTYIFIIFAGIPAAMLYNLLSGIIRSLGDARTPLYFLVFSSLLNVVLDLVLILWTGLGVAGAALATVISEVVSGVLCFVYMLRQYPLLHLSAEDLKPRAAECRELLSMGLPMGLQYSITAIGSTLLQASVNDLGALAMAATTANGRAFGLLACPCDAIGTASAIYTGQNVGAGEFKRVRRGALANLTIGSVYAVLALGAVLLWAEPFLSLFLNPSDAGSAQILAMSRRQMTINTIFLIPLLCVNLYRFAIQGMGYPKAAVIAGVLELAGRGLLALIFVPRFGFDAVCFASPAAWILADLFLLPMFYLGLRRLERRSHRQ